MAPLIFICPGNCRGCSSFAEQSQSSSRGKLQQNVGQKKVQLLFPCFRNPLTCPSFSIVTRVFGFCLFNFSGTLSPRSAQSCPETDGTAKYKFSIPPRQHCGVCQAPFRNPAGETLCLLFYKFRVCFPVSHPPHSQQSLRLLSHTYLFIFDS